MQNATAILAKLWKRYFSLLFTYISAFDNENNILTGEESRLLHVMDLSDPKNPTLATSYQFTPSDGIPRDVAVCGDEVAVAVTSGIKDVYEGHVYFFHAYTSGSPGLTFDGKLPGQNNI